MIKAKLTRDKVPLIVAKTGYAKKECFCGATATVEAFPKLLMAKLIEEAKELYSTDFDSPEFLEELADVEEVLLALKNLSTSTNEERFEIRMKKQREKGGFANRQVIFWEERE